MTGLEDLEASQRAISNLLYQHAHDSGRITEPGAVFEIPMATVRTGISKHESGDRLRASLTALAQIVAKATYTEEGAGGKGRQQRVVIGGLSKFFNVDAAIAGCGCHHHAPRRGDRPPSGKGFHAWALAMLVTAVHRQLKDSGKAMLCGPLDHRFSVLPAIA